MAKIELWGGVECTVNRVADRFYDQTAMSGHDHADLACFADLGLAALRFPMLWERVAPRSLDDPDWRWTDDGLTHLRRLNIRPIAGLVHHGSGPIYTDLLSDGFAKGVARFAELAVRRYPWITDWTPINEPLTTARFSALYGHWYPHLRDERSFWLALLNQIDAIRMAMAAIRAVQPAARLIQTDDLGRTYATVTLRDQAGFDNVRRWMGWDLLVGRVTPDHAMWSRLVGFGFEERLRAIAAAPCPPDVVGINHYLTSDRFLDHRTDRYAGRLAGGNGHLAYIDTEAVRVLAPAPLGLEGALREAWQRYHLPLAVTEVHNGCTREEQMRWMSDAWLTAERLASDGIDMRAVTSWSLLGSRGWDQLLTAAGRYEPGAFDASGTAPRATGLAVLLRALGSGEQPAHPVLKGAGWWRRPIRLHHAPVPRPAPPSDLVFDGRRAEPYVEDDLPAPLNAYGRSKAAAEEELAALDGAHLVIRTAAFFTPFSEHNFAMQLTESLRRGGLFSAAVDQIVTPTYVPDLCDATLDLLIDGAEGVWHLTNAQPVSWFDFGSLLAEACGFDRDRVRPALGSKLGWRAQRPRSVPLSSIKGQLLPPLDRAIERFAEALGLGAGAIREVAGTFPA